MIDIKKEKITFVECDYHAVFDKMAALDQTGKQVICHGMAMKFSNGSALRSEENRTRV